ncbi:tetratricopeptide repeat protein [Alicyclobacillus mengziensis]|uniref:Uncharacterized protein n=1 Tax=Alicyclobacillus mengziensis TaxID=2931921 RepID=A0A9X7VXB7_9BACL|nr:hypothetical protein [Alicyclobacillus mengziensis]QSO46734.1 hypothetical protein JZ786_20190 [Alicyclobacillus mengziensis]
MFHTRRAIELSPDDVSLKEHLLLFHDIPEKLVTTEEARKIAEEIISVAPDSPTAKSILGM